MDLEKAVRQLLEAAGLDPADADFAETPARVTELWDREFLSGYREDPATILASRLTEPHGGDAVLAFNLAFHGLCPHHLVPFQGRAHVGYLPGKSIVGIGQLGRLVACFTQRLTLQERATYQVVQALMTHLGARGAGCVMQARHLCLGIPGDRHASNLVVTSAFAGELGQRDDLKQRLLSQPTER